MKKIITYTTAEILVAFATFGVIYIPFGINETIKFAKFLLIPVALGCSTMLVLAYVLENRLTLWSKRSIMLVLQGNLVLFGLLTIGITTGTIVYLLLVNNKPNVEQHHFFELLKRLLYVFLVFGGLQTFILGSILGITNKKTEQ